MKKVGVVSLLVISMLLFVRCIDYAETMFLKEDGSGTLKMKMSISQMFGEDSGEMTMSEMNEDSLKAKLENKPGLKFLSSKSYEEDGKSVVEIELAFDKIESLNQLDEDGDGPLLIGQLSMTPEGENRVRFERVLSQEKEGEEGEDNAIAEGMAAAMFGNFKFTYEVHFPFHVVEANTADSNIDAGSNTVRWEYSLGNLVGGTQTMTALLEKNGAFPIHYALIVLLLVCAVVLVILIVSGTRAPKEKKKA
jgi:hypothetical protein